MARLQEINQAQDGPTATRIQKLLMGTAQGLIIVGVVGSVGSWAGVGLNTFRLDTLTLTVEAMNQTITETHRLMKEVAVINAIQTTELKYLHDEMNKCRSDIDRLEMR